MTIEVFAAALLKSIFTFLTSYTQVFSTTYRIFLLLIVSVTTYLYFLMSLSRDFFLYFSRNNSIMDDARTLGSNRDSTRADTEQLPESGIVISRKFYFYFALLHFV